MPLATSLAEAVSLKTSLGAAKVGERQPSGEQV